MVMRTALQALALCDVRSPSVPTTHLALYLRHALDLWPLKRVPFVTELATSGPAIEFPVDFLAGTVSASNPSAAFPTKGSKIGNAARSEALPGKHCEFDFRYISRRKRRLM